MPIVKTDSSEHSDNYCIPRRPSWPVSNMLRRRKLCSSESIFEQDKTKFIQQLRLINMPQHVISEIEDIKFSVSLQAASVQSVCRYKTVRLILPYQRMFDLLKVKADFNRRMKFIHFELSKLFGCQVHLRFGGRNCLPNLSLKLRKQYLWGLLGKGWRVKKSISQNEA